MSEPPHSNLTRSLSTFKSKLSSKFKNSNAAAAGNDGECYNNGSVEDNGILAMKYDDLNKEQDQNQSEMRHSTSFTNLSNHELIQSSRNCSIDAGHPIIGDSISTPTTETIPTTDSTSSNSQTTTSNNVTPSQFSLKEKEFSFLQLQNSSNPTSPISSRRQDSIIDPLNTSILSDKLNMAIHSDIVSPQPRSIPVSLPSSINPVPTSSASNTHNNSVSSTSRKSSNISTASTSLPSLQQPVTPTNEMPLSHQALEAQSLELADAMALSILNKVDAGIKIDQNQNVETEWKI